jgi:hypothetical protein
VVLVEEQVVQVVDKQAVHMVQQVLVEEVGKKLDHKVQEAKVGEVAAMVEVFVPLLTQNTKSI